MHLAADRKNSALAFNRLVDLTECYARCGVSETDAAVAALAKSDQSLSLEELEDLPHHDRLVWSLWRLPPKSSARRRRSGSSHNNLLGSGSGTRKRPIAPGESGPCCPDSPTAFPSDGVADPFSQV